jgi:hypothetical protein
MKFWRIAGYHGTDQIWSRDIPVGSMTERQLESLLRCLAACAGLTLDEMPGAFAKRGTKIATTLLDVHRDRVNYTFMCGSNPHFVACIVEHD